MADTSVKWFLSSQSITPDLSASTGSLLSILRAALVTGMGAANVQTLVVAGGVATATYASEHGYLDRQVVLIAGAHEATLNGEHRVTVTGTHTLSFETTQADGAATGSITSKLAPAGWLEVFTGTNVAAFQSQHEDSTGCLLRVDDSGTTSARVVGYESMSDIDTGSGAFPTADAQAGGLYWPKANNTTGSRAWMFAADARRLYLYVQPTEAYPAGSVVGFGDLRVAANVVDPYAAFVSGHATELLTGGAGCLSNVSATTGATLSLMRNAAGTLESVPARLMSAFRTTGVSGGSTGSQLPNYPNAAHGEMLLFEPWVLDGDGLRGEMPGLLHTPQSIAWVQTDDSFGDYLVAPVSGGAVALAVEDWL